MITRHRKAKSQACDAPSEWRAGTAVSFAIVSQGVVSCYHHTD